MEKIIPFKKEIIFNDGLAEITSISLEHDLSINDNSVNGKFIVSGEYKATATSIDAQNFSYNLPFEINLDERYILDNAEIDINDFYYEVVNDKILSINIEVAIDKLDEKEIVTLDNLERDMPMEQDVIVEETPKRCIEKEDINVTNIFDNVDSNRESYKSYSVYIVRDGDSIESILEKYNITKEELEDYNDLSELKLGDKIIIPCNV